jgi:hypothetical protein
MTKYNYTIHGTKNNQPVTLDIQIDGEDQRDSFKFFASYVGEKQEFDEINTVEYKGKYQ